MCDQAKRLGAKNHHFSASDQRGYGPITAGQSGQSGMELRWIKIYE